MWAPDCAYKNGTYYFYFPHPSETDWNDSWKIGVATSNKPAEGFKVQGYVEGMDPMIDPCVFVDDDGQAYIYNGGGGTCKGGKLKDNMMELDGPMQLMKGLEDFHEAAWIHKYNGKYYLSYSDNHDENWNDGVKGTTGCAMRSVTLRWDLGNRKVFIWNRLTAIPIMDLLSSSKDNGMPFIITVRCPGTTGFVLSV